jgi:hypothetical protein
MGVEVVRTDEGARLFALLHNAGVAVLVWRHCDAPGRSSTRWPRNIVTPLRSGMAIRVKTKKPEAIDAPLVHGARRILSILLFRLEIMLEPSAFETPGLGASIK